MEYFVWMTTRKIRAGALDDFEHVWQPNPYPEGLARAYAIGPRTAKRSLASPSGTQRSHVTPGETQKPRSGRQAMAPYVLESREAFYRGRELGIPGRRGNS